MEENNLKLNKTKKNIDLNKIMPWICTAVAVSVGIVVTKNPACLWGFVFPLWNNQQKKKIEKYT